MSQDNMEWQEIGKKAFEAAGLPEIPEHLLEIGTYTNAQMIEMFRDEPGELLLLLMRVSLLGTKAVSKRSILSFAVDMI